MKKSVFALLGAVMLASLAGCMVVPVNDGYAYGYYPAAPAVPVVVPYGYYGGHPYRHHPGGGQWGRW